MSTITQKPPYRVPPMREIADTPRNGLRVISTFSGCGGSCLGYKMAGYDVVWANDIDSAAHAIFRANHPDTILDTRSIRDVLERPVEGEIDLLDGSPPCASFSTAGKVSKGWGKDRVHNGIAQREDDLFDEYVRIIGLVRPRVFVAENVYGLIVGASVGYFKRVHAKMVAQGYRVEARVLDASRLGVPQTRQRVIFIGVRDDLALDPIFPTPLPYVYTLRDAIGEMTLAERALDGIEDMNGYAIGRLWKKMRPGETHAKSFNLHRLAWSKPSPTILGAVAPSRCALHPDEPRAFSVNEIKRLCGFPDDFNLGERGDLSERAWYRRRCERLGLAVPPPMMRAIAEVIRDEILLERTK